MPSGRKSAASLRVVPQTFDSVEDLDWEGVKAVFARDLDEIVGLGNDKKSDQEFVAELGMTGDKLEALAERVIARMPKRFGDRKTEDVVKLLRFCQTLDGFVEHLEMLKSVPK